MNKIEVLAKNISIVRNALAKIDFAVIDSKDACGMKKELNWIAELFQIYIDFENGFDPDKEAE